MKKALLLVSVCFTQLFAFAQTTTTTTITTTKTVVTTYNGKPRELRPIGSELSIGVETGLAVGNLKHYSSMGVGGSVKYAYNFNESMAATFQSGYISFISKNPTHDGTNYGNGKIKTSQIPFKAGFRYSLGRFYMEPQLGVSLLRQKMIDTGNSDNTTGFTYAGNIGVLATRDFDISVRYEGISKSGGSIGYLGLRLAYSFPFGK
ncbi:MAG: hypothetical protein DI598_08615 [Pseudopedobacter saltans]|uniref:Outer membrane protein beta-barrel domain-containing protein n=1 Tax=Pseudopedobacter saltans TaxID=151895 RepID=A0A2W5EYQ0_9SPHI|nr:MAG: hypothetical protein DI598_08615 [Pseudopedobacter saltans]